MAVTTNPTVTAAWSAIVPAGSYFMLTLPFATRYDIEVATTDAAGTAPTVVGHVLSGDQQEGLTRDLLGPGTVWARTRSGSTTVVLNTWS